MSNSHKKLRIQLNLVAPHQEFQNEIEAQKFPVPLGIARDRGGEQRAARETSLSGDWLNPRGPWTRLLQRQAGSTSTRHAAGSSGGLRLRSSWETRALCLAGSGEDRKVHPL